VVPDLMVKFDGRTIASALAEYSGTIEVNIIGYLIDGDAFAGSDLVQIRN
jgi:hypothetical protein